MDENLSDPTGPDDAGDPDDAVDAVGEPVLDVFWRPGCPYCFALRQALVRARVPVGWHNIWDDPVHAAFVRSVADGNETVPTVVLDGTVYVNPSAHKLLGLLDDAYPDLERHASKRAARRAFRESRAADA